MKDYSKAAPTFWTGDTGRKIRAAGRDAQVVAFYLFTCPSSNWIGIFYLPLPTLCHEVGISHEGASKALRSLEEIDYAYYDHATETVWVPGTARFQIGEDLKPEDKRIIKIIKDLQKVTNTGFRSDFYRRYGCSYCLPDASEPDKSGEGLRRGFNAPPKPVTEAVAVTETEEQTTPHAAGAAAVDPSPFELEATRLSELLRSRIAARDGNAKAAKLPVKPGWVSDIEKLLRIDGRRPEDVEKVIEWCQSDGCFWAPNILSGRSLREKYDTMWGQMRRASGRKPESTKQDTIGSSPPDMSECRNCEGVGRMLVVTEKASGELLAVAPWSAMREDYYRAHEPNDVRVFRCFCEAGKQYPNYQSMPAHMC